MRWHGLNMLTNDFNMNGVYFDLCVKFHSEQSIFIVKTMSGICSKKLLVIFAHALSVNIRMYFVNIIQFGSANLFTEPI